MNLHELVAIIFIRLYKELDSSLGYRIIIVFSYCLGSIVLKLIACRFNQRPIGQKKLIISLALIGLNGDAGCVLIYNLFYFLAKKREDAA